MRLVMVTKYTVVAPNSSDGLIDSILSSLKENSSLSIALREMTEMPDGSFIEAEGRLFILNLTIDVLFRNNDSFTFGFSEGVLSSSNESHKVMGRIFTSKTENLTTAGRANLALAD